jgi:hypothetical protein
MSRKSEIRAAMREGHPVHDAVAIGRETHKMSKDIDPETSFGPTDQPDVAHQLENEPGEFATGGLARFMGRGK